MTGDLVPLLLLWALGSRRCATPASSSPPSWPTAASPPPPMPPLPPVAPSADTGTPLSDLAQPKAPPPSAAAPPSDDPFSKMAAKMRSEAERVVRKNLGLKKPAAKAAPKRKTFNTKARLTKVPPKASSSPAFLNYAPPDYDVSVADVQKVLVSRGYKSIKRDGLYGPKTELAWKALANGKKLPAAIVRLAPKIARVNRETFTTLSIP